MWILLITTSASIFSPILDDIWSSVDITHISVNHDNNNSHHVRKAMKAKGPNYEGNST
jgi:hypothetical protein